ncbi:MAG: ThuA domain-containing protein [Flavitalea sp.]
MKLGIHSRLWLAGVFVFALLVKTDSAVSNDQFPLQARNVDTIKKKKIVFLITKDPDNYEADKTVPLFADMLHREYDYAAIVLLGEGAHGAYRYPHMEIINDADLVVVFARRIALPYEQINIVKKYLSSGKPLVGIRTANHAFTVREKVEEGYEDWPEFVADILGCENRGYGPVEPGIEVSVVAGSANHPILKNVHPQPWHSKGNGYLVAPLLDDEARVLLEAKVNDIIQPVAWTRTAGKSKIFYTSLGFPADFQSPQFTALLVGGIQWALTK